MSARPKTGEVSGEPPHELPPMLWLGAPFVVALAPYVLQALGFRHVLFGESGLVEWLTVVFLAVAIFYTLAALRARPRAGWFTAYLAVFALGAVYFAGEELSWGQHVFGWSTPEGWADFNDQGETNLHNSWPLFDQAPRLALSLAALIGGIGVPLYRRRRGIAPPPPGCWAGLWPTMVCLPVAALALGVSVFDDIVETLGIAPRWLDVSAGELKECLLALFIMIYIASLRRRLPAAV